MVLLGRPSYAIVVLQIVASFSSAVSAMRLESLERRAAQTNAVCLAEFAWADNSRKKSPCQVAAEVNAPCSGGNWIVPALVNTSDAYTNPGVGTSPLTACSCSWAAYNLLMACTECQGRPQGMKNWGDYSRLCTEFESTSYYPSGYLADDTFVPAWATVNPAEWSDRRFSVAQARALAAEGRPDLTAEDTKPKKKSAVGPIVGGVVGAIVVVALAAGIAYFMWRKHKQKGAKDLKSEKHGHNRGPSDATMTSLGYTTMSSPSPGPGGYRNAVGTIRTHATSPNNFSTFAPNGNTIYTTSPSPPPQARVVSANPEDVIIPFSLQTHSRNDSSTTFNRDRKSPNGPVAVYDSPNAPPTMAGDALFQTPERPRVNPPAYSPHPTNDTPSASGSQQARRRNGHTTNSSDADLSYASFNANGAVQGNQAAGSSGSDIYTSHPNERESVFGGSVQQTTYTSPSAYPRDVKRRPTEESVNPSNIG